MVRIAPRWLAPGLALASLLLVACESPDVSYRTSPSARTLLGNVTSGEVYFNLPELPPDPVAAPDGWSFDTGNARWEELQNGVPSLFYTTSITTKPGTTMEIWLADTLETVVKWTGGSSQPYSGTVCWQQELKAEDVVLPLDKKTQYTLTVTFRDPDDGGVVASNTVPVRGNVPSLSGTPAQSGSDVFRQLLTCPKGS